MTGIGVTIGSLDHNDLEERFSKNFARLEHGRVNEMVFFEVNSKFPPSYSAMMATGEYFLNRYVS